MASGLPVVASKATAAAIDRIRDRKNGYLFETESVEDLILVIERILDSTNLDNVSKAARLTAEEWPLSRAVEILQTLVAAT
jgi:glycosyltransferase involved in cell wall biosynthesis